MKKTVVLKALLIVFPILAVGLATTVNSVTVFDTVTGVTEYYSYFDVLPVTNLQMITPLTGMVAALSGVLAAVYMVKKNVATLKAVGYAALASACLASIPMVIREQILVIPNVALPIFMVAEYIVAYILEKQEVQKTKKIPKAKHKKK